MKKLILKTIVTLICVLVLASCGTATDTSSNATSANTTEPTTAVVTTVPTTQTTTITTTATTTKPTTIATTAKPRTSAKKTSAKTVAHKAATTTKKKVVATTAKKTEARNYSLNAGLTDTEVLWAQKQANEYIKTLKGVTLEPSADGYTISSGIPSWCITKEKLLSRLKEAIDCDYESSLEADWHDIGMYVKMEKDEYGIWAYTIMNVCNG